MIGPSQDELNALWKHLYPESRPQHGAFLAHENCVFRCSAQPDPAGDTSYGTTTWLPFCEVVGENIGSHGLEFELAPNVKLLNTPNRLMEILLEAYPDRPKEVIALFWDVAEAAGWQGPVHSRPTPQPGTVQVQQACFSEGRMQLVALATYDLEDVRPVYNQVAEDCASPFASFITRDGIAVRVDCHNKLLSVKPLRKWTPSSLTPPTRLV